MGDDRAEAAGRSDVSPERREYWRIKQRESRARRDARETIEDREARLAAERARLLAYHGGEEGLREHWRNKKRNRSIKRRAEQSA